MLISIWGIQAGTCAESWSKLVGIDVGEFVAVIVVVERKVVFIVVSILRSGCVDLFSDLR
jgi:hypothetical protein